jgi:hypothetical protein
MIHPNLAHLDYLTQENMTYNIGKSRIQRVLYQQRISGVQQHVHRQVCALLRATGDQNVLPGPILSAVKFILEIFEQWREWCVSEETDKLRRLIICRQSYPSNFANGNTASGSVVVQ